jgi:hypothetical protein
VKLLDERMSEKQNGVVRVLFEEYDEKLGALSYLLQYE